MSNLSVNVANSVDLSPDTDQLIYADSVSGDDGTTFSWITDGGDKVTATGTNFKYENGLPTGGVVSKIEIDLDNNNSEGGSDIVITEVGGASLAEVSGDYDAFLDAVFGGDDRIVGSAADDDLFGSSGSDTIIGGSSQKGTELGSEGDALIKRSEITALSTMQQRPLNEFGGEDEIHGGDGNDLLIDVEGRWMLDGEAVDSDTLFGDGGNDTLRAGIGDDFLYGGNDNDILEGGIGRDLLEGGTGNDTYAGSLFELNGDTIVGAEDGEVIDLFKDPIQSDEQLSYNSETRILSIEIDRQPVELNNQSSELNMIPGGRNIPPKMSVNDVIDEPIGKTETYEITFAGNRDLSFKVQDGKIVISENGGGSGGSGGTGSGTAGQLFPGTDDADTLIGSDDADTITGGGGGDSILAGDGDDVVLGGAGNDTAAGGDGNDEIYAGSGNDAIAGGTGADTLGGGEGDDEIYAGADDDVVYGGDGADTTYGGDGNDAMFGGDGDDILAGGNGDDEIGGGLGNDEIAAGDGADTVYGAEGDDTIFAAGGADSVFGGAGDDVIYLGASDGAEDVYNSTADNGDDTVYGFENGTDLLNLTGSGFTSFADIEGQIGVDADGNATIDLGDGDILTLVGVDPSDLDETDFQF